MLLAQVANQGRPSTGCEEAMSAAASVPLSVNADTELDRTAHACGSVEEWADAARKYPDAMGVTDPSFIDPAIDLIGICRDKSPSPVCLDARQLGLF